MKIGLCGSQGTGKTTVLNEFIKTHLQYKIVKEVARQCPYPINKETGYISQRWILHEQIKKELSNYPYDQISDRTTIDQIAYIERAFRYGNMSYREYQELITIAESWIDTYEYIFFFPIEFPLVIDGIRSDDIQFQKEIDGIIKDNIINKIQIHKVTGTVEQRLEQIEKLIK